MEIKTLGKWQIVMEDKWHYLANLYNSNGEVILRSEAYSALSGVKSGIETIKKNIESDNFALSVDKNGKYFFKLYSSSTRLLCVSDTFQDLETCKNNIEQVKRFYNSPITICK